MERNRLGLTHSPLWALKENYTIFDQPPEEWEVVKETVLNDMLAGKFQFPVASYFAIKDTLKANIRRFGLQLKEARFTKPGTRMAFGIADFRFSIPGFTRDDVIANDPRLGPTWFLTKKSRLVWTVLIPTLDAYIRGHEKPVVERKYSGGAYGITGSLKLDALRRSVFPEFDKASTNTEWGKLLFDKRSGPSYVPRIEQDLRKEMRYV